MMSWDPSTSSAVLAPSARWEWARTLSKAIRVFTREPSSSGSMSNSSTRPEKVMITGPVRLVDAISSVASSSFRLLISLAGKCRAPPPRIRRLIAALPQEVGRRLACLEEGPCRSDRCGPIDEQLFGVVDQLPANDDRDLGRRTRWATADNDRVAIGPQDRHGVTIRPPTDE